MTTEQAAVERLRRKDLESCWTYSGDLAIVAGLYLAEHAADDHVAALAAPDDLAEARLLLRGVAVSVDGGMPLTAADTEQIRAFLKRTEH